MLNGMSKVVFFFQSLDPYAVKEALPAAEVSVVHTKARCADYIIENPDVDGIFLQRDALGQEHRRFMESVKLHFPLITVGLISPVRPEPMLEDCVLIVHARMPEIIGREIGLILADAARREKRASVRYDWPLKGRLIRPGEPNGAADGMPCRVRSLSSGGAFLETGNAALKEKDPIRLGIEFLNQRCALDAVVVSLRPAGARTKSGCGVRFNMPPQAAVDLFERVVRDALMQALLNPDEEVKPPALDDQDLLIPGFESA